MSWVCVCRWNHYGRHARQGKDDRETGGGQVGMLEEMKAQKKKSLDSVRHPFRLFVTEHGTDKLQPNNTHTGESLCSATLWSEFAFAGLENEGLTEKRRWTEWASVYKCVHEQTERGWALGLVPFLCTSISIEYVLSLRGFTWIQGCPNNWK